MMRMKKRLKSRFVHHQIMDISKVRFVLFSKSMILVLLEEDMFEMSNVKKAHPSNIDDIDELSAEKMILKRQ